MVITVYLAQKKRGRKFHIMHPWAECLDAIEISNFAPRMAILVNYDEDLRDFSHGFESLQGSYYIGQEDICGNCLRNLKYRLNHFRPNTGVS